VAIFRGTATPVSSKALKNHKITGQQNLTNTAFNSATHQNNQDSTIIILMIDRKNLSIVILKLNLLKLKWSKNRIWIQGGKGKIHTK
jgi:hypothetical protein